MFVRGSIRFRRRALKPAALFRRDLKLGGLRLESLEERTLLHAGGLDDVPTYLPPQYSLFNYHGFLTAPSTAAPLEVANAFLHSHEGALGLLPGDLDNYFVTTNFVTQETGATTLTFQQSFHGSEVANANFNITVSATSQILSVAGGFVQGLGQRAAEQPRLPSISATQAVVRLAEELNLPLTGTPTITETAPGTYTAVAVGLSQDVVTIRPRYVSMPGGDVNLTWNLTVRTPDNAHWYNVDLDTTTGELIAALDYASDAAYEVLAIPTESPDDGPRTVQTDPHIITPTPSTVPSPFGWHDTNGATGGEFTITQGNNVNSYADRNADDVPDAGSQPDGGPGLNFTGALVPFNQAGQPDSYTPAAVTNLFYWTNILHDVHYLYGFDEAARNFQVNTYGRGGIGNDAVNAEAQDGSGLNNANFATPPDGTSPRMQMYEFNLTSPRRDGDFDPEIIIHEFGHGVSNRLTGNASGLNALQSGGLGEGWSDWWALMLTQESASETTTGRGAGTYVLGQPTNGPGIRDFRYDFDIGDVNLETFLNYGTGTGQDTEVHESGTRWAATLWDLNHLLIQKYGFEPNVYDSTSSAGNIRALHLIMNALKIQPLNPSFVDARDAILIADFLLYGGADQLQIWTAFARRGLGEFASTPNSDSTSLTTSFEIPPGLDAEVSIGADVARLEGTGGTTDFIFTVTLDQSVSDPVTVHYATVDGTAVSPGDFTAQSGTLTFSPGGDLSRTITIQVVGDNQGEADESFFLQLSEAENATVGRSEATGTILNDDIDFSILDVTLLEGNSGTSNAVFTVSAVGEIDQSVTLNFTTQNGTALANVDYLSRAGAVTFAPGAATAAIIVPIVGDVFNEATETFSVRIFGPSSGRIIRGVAVGTIIDNDPLPGLYVNDVRVTATEEGSFFADFTIALDAPSGREVSVEFLTQDVTAQAGNDYTTLSGLVTFVPGVTTHRVTVEVQTHDEAANRTFTLNLLNPVNSILADPHGMGTIIIADAIVEERTIDNGDPGYSQTAGWVNLTNTQAYELDYDYHAQGAGANSATWTFDDLSDGEYQVFTRWIAFTNRATNAPYSIFDGGTPEGAQLVNQRLAPVGEELGGFTWQSLGTFQISSGTLVVRLGDNANGLVVADAVRIVAGAVVPQIPEMDVAGSGRSIGTLDEAPSFDDGTDFGTVAMASSSSTRTFTIANSGNVDLHLLGSPRVEILGDHPDDFSVLVQPSAVIGAGFESTFEIMFHPQETGSRRAMISIANDDNSEQPYTFAIRGTGGSQGPAQFTIDDTASGYRTIGAWTTNANTSSFGGQYHAFGAGQGGEQSTWRFTNLAPGQYDVLTTWVPFGNRATNAPFTIADGNVSQNTLLVNQQQAPDGVSADGVEWQMLTSLFVTTGELKVSLSNAANGFVIADAVRIARQGAAPIAVSAAPTVIHNLAMPLDVNGDQRITSFDALLVISALLPRASTSGVQSASAFTAATASVGNVGSSYYLDVNDDGRVSAFDALTLISYLLTPITQASPSAAPAANSASGVGLVAQPQAAAAVDQAIIQIASEESDSDDPAVGLADAAPAPALSLTPPAAPTPLLTPVSVRAVFASSSKKGTGQTQWNSAYDAL
jgi:extracellular elastinolytic metalloproteinase